MTTTSSTTNGALKRSTPSRHGISATGIDAFLDALESTSGVEPHSLMFLRGGEVVAEGWWAPYAAEHPHLLYSLSKSFTSTAVGFAIAEGLMSLDDTIIQHFPEFDAEITDERTRSMRVRDLLAMASGHLSDMIDDARATDPTDFVHGFLLLPPERKPGSVFTYNQCCTFTLGAIVQKLSGSTLGDYLTPRLFGPLGIAEHGWNRDPLGREVGWTGLHARTEAVAKLGQLYLQKGVWEGEQLLPAAWVADATVSHIDNHDEGKPDWSSGYGYQFWIARHGYRGDGAYGQFCMVLPEHDVVVAMTGQSLDMQAVLDAAWEHLLPALDAGGDAAADEPLALRLSRLALPAPPAPTDARPFVGAYEPAANASTDASATSVRRVEVRRDAGDGVTLHLAEEGGDLTLSVGLGEWVVTEAFAVCAADDASGILRIDVIALETPHRLHLRLDGNGATFRAEWETVPLQPTLVRDLRMPRD